MTDTDMWGVAEAASHCGVTPGTWRVYVSRGFAPPPDDPDEGYPPQRRRPKWSPETVRTWHENRPSVRPGRGNHTSGAQRTPGSRRRKT